MLFLILLAASGTLAKSWKSDGLKNLKASANLVTFGDSYSDEGRLAAYYSNHGQPPPLGTSTAGSNLTASGGYSWGHFAKKILKANYYDYAVSGAFCSNETISRFNGALNRTFPSVLEDEIPSYLLEINNKTFYDDRKSDNTIYALWIGTNDLGLDAFLTDSQHAGLTITNFVDCIWKVFDPIYESGGRHFVLFNEAPLENSPMYAAPENYGTLDNKYWPNKTSYNMTEYQNKMRQYTTNVNTMFKYGVPYQILVENKWEGASFTIFDVHSLIRDIHNEPEKYLDAPADSTSYYYQCDVHIQNCTPSKHSLSSFLWYDELHPSAKADEIIGTEFAKLVHGESNYATYW